MAGGLGSVLTPGTHSSFRSHNTSPGNMVTCKVALFGGGNVINPSDVSASDGQEVKEWRNLVGFADNAEKFVSDNPQANGWPRYNLMGPGGFPSVRFQLADGSGGTRTMSVDGSLANFAGSSTVLTVYEVFDNLNDYTMLRLNNAAGSSGPKFQASNPDGGVGIIDAAGAKHSFQSGGSLLIGEIGVVILALRFDGTRGVARYDYLSPITTIRGGSLLIAKGDYGINAAAQLGNQTNLGDEPFRGEISQMLIFEGIMSDAGVENYIANNKSAYGL